MHRDITRLPSDVRPGFSSTLIRFPFLLVIILLVVLLVQTVARSQTPDQTLGIGERENLGPGVNSEWAEFVPLVAPDGTRLYFDRKYSPQNTGGTDDQDDIYYSDRLPNGTWGPAVNIGAPLNTPGSDVLFWISADGSSAVLYHGKMIDGRERGLSISRKSGAGWGEPTAISIEGVKNLGNYYYTHLSVDGKHMILAFANGTDTLNLDLFHSEALNTELTRWSTPVPMQTLNTPFIEGSPFLLRDTRTLLFITDRAGQGGGLSDIFFSRRIGEDWRWWTPAENLGYAANSPMFEAGVSLSPDEKRMYVSRIAKEPGSFGRTDLFSQTFPDTLRSQSTFILPGRIVVDGSGSGIKGTVYVSLLESSQTKVPLQTRSDGSFDAVVPPGSLIIIRAEAPGYEPGGVTYDARYTNPLQTVAPITISLRPSGKSLPVSDRDEWTILFANGEDGAQGKAVTRSLDEIARRWKGSNTITLTVAGHADSVGVESENTDLSRRRAEKIAALLVQRGIPRERIEITALGESRPAEDNATARGRRLSRRVVITVRK